MENFDNITENFIRLIRECEGIDKQLIDDTISNIDKIKTDYISQYKGKYLRLQTDNSTIVYKVNTIVKVNEGFKNGYYIDGVAIKRTSFANCFSRPKYEITVHNKIYISAKDWESVTKIDKTVAQRFYNGYMQVIDESKFVD